MFHRRSSRHLQATHSLVKTQHNKPQALLVRLTMTSDKMISNLQLEGISDLQLEGIM